MRLAKQHWDAWVYLCRQTVDIGYPRQVAWYLPPRLGNTFDAESFHKLTDDDFKIAELMCQAWGELRNNRETHAAAVREFYGAYPEPPPRLKDRILKLHMERRTVYRLVDEGKLWIEGSVSQLEKMWHSAEPPILRVRA